MAETILQVSNIETYYDKVRALHGVSFEIKEGSITAILGNNGAGKTTTLNTVMGLLDDQPDKGTIHFSGERIDGKDTEKIVAKGIGYVPEGREVFDELTVKENLLVGAYLRKDRKGIQEDLDKMFSFFPVLKDRLQQQAGTLSGGEQQMLAISRALMNRPKLLLMDEPSLGLSPALVKMIFDIIPMIRDEGITVLLVEQNANMALKVADFGYIMENGRFVTSGTAKSLQEDEDVKEFYLGIKTEVSVKGQQRYKRKRRWG
ncbi:MAG: ABC transporter ATP-binding protein [Saprospiraceae bacterium]|nr:ABC transporter ATP-binding protein [Saprospiraceae bacterium]